MEIRIENLLEHKKFILCDSRRITVEHSQTELDMAKPYYTINNFPSGSSLSTSSSDMSMICLTVLDKLEV